MLSAKQNCFKNLLSTKQRKTQFFLEKNCSRHPVFWLVSFFCYFWYIFGKKITFLKNMLLLCSHIVLSVCNGVCQSGHLPNPITSLIPALLWSFTKENNLLFTHVIQLLSSLAEKMQAYGPKRREHEKGHRTGATMRSRTKGVDGLRHNGLHDAVGYRGIYFSRIFFSQLEISRPYQHLKPSNSYKLRKIWPKDDGSCLCSHIL